MYHILFIQILVFFVKTRVAASALSLPADSRRASSRAHRSRHISETLSEVIAELFACVLRALGGR